MATTDKKYLTLDFETYDPFISRDMGSGWVFAVNKVPGCDFRVLGCAIRTYLDEESEYLDLVDFEYRDSNIMGIQDFINDADVLVMHNAAYDLGCLEVLGIDVNDKPIIDTMIAAKLYKSSLNSYALDFLGKKYLKIGKDDGMIDACIKADLFPYLKRELTDKTRAEKNQEVYLREFDDKRTKAVGKWVISNMDIMQEHCYNDVAKYACRDVDITWKLLEYFLETCEQRDYVELCKKYSFVIYPCMQARRQGMRIDLNRAREAIREMEPIIEAAERKVFEMAGEEFNLKSNKDVPRIFDKLGIKYPYTDKGNPSIRAPWLEEQGHPICVAIVTARKYKNITNNFMRKMITMQVHTLGMTEEEVAYQDYGRIYPEWKPHSAKTGRMTCTKPNVQQIPKRDKKVGPICRSLFIPEEGEILFAPDWSNQEGRIHIHYARLLKCNGVELFIKEFIDNPDFDLHTRVANLMLAERFIAKVIYLAKAYGAGGAKVCDQLGLPTSWWTPPGSKTKIRIAGDKGRSLITGFNDAIPYLKELSEKCVKSMTDKGYITTIGGRRIHVEYAPVAGKLVWFYFRALSSLSQGSGYDQTVDGAIAAYLAGIRVIGYIHDEFVASGTQEEGAKLQQIMIDAAKLEIPSYVDLGQGANWNEAH